MRRPRWHERQILRELTPLGGSLAWTTVWGLGIDLSNRPITAVTFSRLIYTLPRVVWLDLSDTPADDACLRVLQCATRLEALDLARTRTTAAGMRSLATLPNLVEINLGGMEIPAEDEASWRKMGLRAVIRRD